MSARTNSWAPPQGPKGGLRRIGASTSSVAPTTGVSVLTSRQVAATIADAPKKTMLSKRSQPCPTVLGTCRCHIFCLALRWAGAPAWRGGGGEGKGKGAGTSLVTIWWGYLAEYVVLPVGRWLHVYRCMMSVLNGYIKATTNSCREGAGTARQSHGQEEPGSPASKSLLLFWDKFVFFSLYSDRYSMMDPISALSLAVNIIDIVDKAIKGVEILIEVSSSVHGLSSLNKTIHDAADHIENVVDNIQECEAKSPPGIADDSIRRISNNIKAQCRELQSVLKECQRKKGFASALRATFSTVFNKQKVEEVQRNIIASRVELFDWVAVSSRTTVNKIAQEFEQTYHKVYDIRDRLESVGAMFVATLGGTDVVTELDPTACLDEMKQVVADRVILELLEVQTLHSRFDSVVTQARGTFEWIFTDPNTVFEKEPHLATTFPDWLESGSGIFHICGRPGSGKSTLMKFLCRHTATTELLQKWAGDDELLFARFFFWRFGPDEQTSIGGLVRSLLYQILCRQPRLLRQVFTEQIRGQVTSGLRRRPGAVLDSEAVMAAFSRLIQVSASPSHSQEAAGTRICLFIDGLDEFDDSKINTSRRQLVENLLTWASNSNGHVKICVSSRIEEPFMQRLDRTRRIQLHNLTRGDISICIKSTLGAHPTFLKHQGKSPRECEALISDLEEDGGGVFIWVALVLKELEICLDDGISIEFLRGIVRETPQDFDQFLQSILNRINKHHRNGVEVLLAALLRSSGTLMSCHDPDSKRYIAADVSPGMTHYLHLIGAFLILQATDKGVSMLDTVNTAELNIGKEAWFDPEMKDSEVLDTIGDIIDRRCRGLVNVGKGGTPPMVRVEFTHQSIPEFLVKYFCQLPGSGLDKDHRATLTLSWAHLMAMKWEISKMKGVSHASFLRGGEHFNHLILRVDKQGGNLGNDVFGLPPLLVLIRQLKLDETWEDVFSILASMGHLSPSDPMVIGISVRAGLHEFIEWLSRKTHILEEELHCDEAMSSALQFLTYYPWGDHEDTDRTVHENILRIMELLFTRTPSGLSGHLALSSPTSTYRAHWHHVLAFILDALVSGYSDAVLHEALLELWLKYKANHRMYLIAVSYPAPEERYGYYFLCDLPAWDMAGGLESVNKLCLDAHRRRERIGLNMVAHGVGLIWIPGGERDSWNRSKMRYFPKIEPFLSLKEDAARGVRRASLKRIVRRTHFSNKSRLLEFFDSEDDDDDDGDNEEDEQGGFFTEVSTEREMSGEADEAQGKAQARRLEGKDDAKTKAPTTNGQNEDKGEVGDGDAVVRDPTYMVGGNRSGFPDWWGMMMNDTVGLAFLGFLLFCYLVWDMM